MEIILGIDIGQKRSGLAKSDPLGIVISPIETIQTSELHNKILELKKTFNIPQIIIGIPENAQNNQTKEFILKKVSELGEEILGHSQIIFEDESYSSKEAEEIIKSKGIHINEGNKSLIDSYAACILLEQYFRS